MDVMSKWMLQSLPLSVFEGNNDLFPLDLVTQDYCKHSRMPIYGHPMKK